MLITKLVIRILDAEERLLGWAETHGEARGDGCLWIAQPVVLFLEVEGAPSILSIHWCDVNVEVRQPLGLQPKYHAGQPITLPFPDPVIICGPAASGLAPVTVRSPITIGVPPGVLGAKVH